MTTAAFRDRANGRYPITLDEVRQRFSGAFGEVPPQSVLDALGLDPVEAVDPPAYDPVTQSLTEGAPEQAGDGWRQTWAVTVLPPPPAPTNADVDVERDRRLEAGVTYGDAAFQTDAASRGRIDRSRISAIAAIMGGAQPGDLRWHGLPVDFFWIAADDSRVPMDASTMVDFGNMVAAREGLLIVAGNNIKRRLEGGETIGNVGDDALWPTA